VLKGTSNRTCSCARTGPSEAGGSGLRNFRKGENQYGYKRWKFRGTSGSTVMEKLRNVVKPDMLKIPVYLPFSFLGMIAVSGSVAGHWKASINSSISETISGCCLARLRFSPMSDSRL